MLIAKYQEDLSHITLPAEIFGKMEDSKGLWRKEGGRQ
jgi:hypothetical protein